MIQLARTSPSEATPFRASLAELGREAAFSSFFGERRDKMDIDKFAETMDAISGVLYHFAGALALLAGVIVLLKRVL